MFGKDWRIGMTKEMTVTEIIEFCKNENRCEFISMYTHVPIEGEDIGNSRSANKYHKG